MDRSEGEEGGYCFVRQRLLNCFSRKEGMKTFNGENWGT